ncbi:MAG: hypothetical protein KAJ14_02105 [Candidatus Omnitrophica bacterium]|nr:hypothetical protein [Spirochaetota bacterium]MCK5491886.1 hypothetical protein [Candidatus Omnitrophota bacterium]
MKKSLQILTLILVTTLITSACNPEQENQENQLTMTTSGAIGIKTYTAPANTKITISTNSNNGLIEGILVSDGAGFDYSSQTAWNDYALTYNLYFVIGFDGYSTPFAIHTTNTIQDSLFAAKDIGVISLVDDDQDVIVSIDEVNVNTRWIKVSYQIPIYSYQENYPPIFSNSVQTNGTITGSFQGTFEYGKLILDL